MPVNSPAPSRGVRTPPLAKNRRRPQIGSLFWWTIASIVLGICAVLSWFFSIYIFDNPHQPLPYRILTNLEKIEPPMRFKAESPPQGRFRSPRFLYEEDYAGFEQRHLDHINGILLRDYLENFKRAESVTYVKGTFVTEQVSTLGPDDMFQNGLVWHGHAEGFPNAKIRVVLPTGGKTPATLIPLDTPFKLEGQFFAALIHVAKSDDDTMTFTLIPIVYGSKQIAKGTKIAPLLNLKGHWPPNLSADSTESDTAATDAEPAKKP